MRDDHIIWTNMNNLSLAESPIPAGGKGLVILGMHRSGTSALTGLLNKLGLSTGRNLLSADKNNERGYFEDIHLNQQHDVMLKHLGRSWSDVRLFPAGWFEQDWVATARDKLAGHFLAEFDLDRMWVLKDPRVCRLLPVWKQIFARLRIQPGYIFSIRHPLEVAASLEKRNSIKSQHAFLLYALYLLEAERETRDLPRVVVSYTDLLNDWHQVVQMISDNLGVLLPEVDNEMSQQVDDFLSRSLQHHKLSCEDRERTGFDNEPCDIAIRAYQLLARPNPFIDPEAFDDLWDRLERYLVNFNPWIEAQYERDCLIDFMTRGGGQPNENVERLVGHGALSTIYWCSESDSSYLESKTIKLPLHYGSRETLRFVVPVDGKDLNKMRWDIADRAVLCEVFQAWVENTKAEKVWQWEQQMPLFSDTSADMKRIRSTDEAKRLFILSTGLDPYGQLLIPPDVIGQIDEGWAFVAVLSVALPMMALPKLCDLLEECASETATKIEPSSNRGEAVNRMKADFQIPRLAEGLDEVLISLRSTLALRDSTIINQQQLQRKLRQELIRAEGQLDFLKDVLLNKSGSDSL